MCNALVTMIIKKEKKIDILLATVGYENYVRRYV